ncbi:MAG: hypothetical protein UX99_C0030G0005 [Candidatus Amesbacteria bacterium GW2011_GWB1_47_26]|uniref:MalT-like TPR region domain-containing protein n=1 Tax=Candidatus Amesbacteria bacterium GW2011_GWC2_45_19 TaxID=1618366 RepID=A0A0G1M482_9BACT|nr:MAG: hypothetical protein UX05_C0004G0018 [Candidatus Amesbacteria bacterium GW2011_GWC2_45_19]KKU37534.1 MAG: hypothetical protein UX52_C0023G0007 [Candidatus Amesbacteria bacterium GW2011_GWA1_46_35]KKU73454.1 MAG: hypothetical protein UX99_C0030G0005 [Candidatus Amesbacteria bacterium GW2011_GWB1_47_26]KKU78732.1 MAG: hypothetical protein UY06_C0041G0002 [Candidatus Amesbacteria bacterium GW2011_GWA2_47_70]
MSKNAQEGNRLLSLGERVRENPHTILLSIPILGFAIIWLKLVRDREGQAAGYGHLGLTFKLLYKHHWKNKLLQTIAYDLFSKAVDLATGDGRPTIILKMAQISGEQGNWKKAKDEVARALLLAKQIGDDSQYAYLLAHLGRIKIMLDDMPGAKSDLENSLKNLTAITQKESTMRLQVWMSTPEMILSEWYLAASDNKNAKLWAQKVIDRAEKYDLKTRKLDGQNLLKRISSHG